MKNLRVVLVLTFVLSASAFVRAEVSDPQTQYAQAVKSYVDAASEEMRALRGNVDAQVASINTESEKKRFEAVFANIAEGDKLLVELKKAGPRDFDRIKGQYEKTRAEASAALSKANKS